MRSPTATAALPKSFPARSIAGCTRAELLDLNGDGFPDYVEVISGVGGGDRWKVHFGTGSGFQEEEALWAKPAFENQNCLVGIRSGVGNLGLLDLNGDGLLDRIRHSGLVYLNRGPVPGLLSRATHPLGGSVEFEYELSAQMKDATGHPANPGFSLSQPVVTRMTVSDGRLGTPQIVTEFHYSDGRFDYTEGEFRGFGSVTRLNLEASDPNTRGSEIISTYLTDRVCAGRLSRREVRHGSTVYRREFHDYEVVGGPDVPGLDTRDQWSRCLRVESRFEAIEGDEEAKRVRRVVHDYGPDPVAEHYNILRIEDWGEWDPTREADVHGDERITYFSYARPRDAGSQIVSEVAESWITDADDAASILSHERFYYDGLPLGLVSRGLRTRVERLYENPHASPPISGEWIATATVEYDRFGNTRSVTGPGTEDDANGFVEWIAWDPVYRTFPVAIVAGADSADPVARGFQYDGCVDGRDPPPALGLPCRTFKGSTALGGAELELHEFAYDGLGRVERIEFPGGLTETRSYALAEPGHVAESIWRSDLQLREGTELPFLRVLDGLARVILEESPGRLSERIRIERGFDERGRLAWETLPHFADTPPGSVLSRAISYDPLARARELLDLDSTTRRVWSYAPWKLSEEVYFGELSSTNRQLHSERVFDGRARLVRVAGFEHPGEASATAFDVTAEYDPLDRVVRIMDPIANDPSLCDVHAMGPRCRTQHHVTEMAYDSLGARTHRPPGCRNLELSIRRGWTPESAQRRCGPRPLVCP
jgi:hypothetical protein